MIVIDTNALVILLIGMVDPRQFKTHKATSIYTEKDYLRLLKYIGNLEHLLTLPNILTEADNLLNRFQGDLRYGYARAFLELVNRSTERYLPSTGATDDYRLSELGLADTLLLQLAETTESTVISGDSQLADYARAAGLNVVDLVALRNQDFLK